MATPPLGVPGFAETHSAIDAAVAAVLDDDTNARNVDIVGAAVSMAAITMDRVEVMLNRLRGRGRRMKNPHLLTLARPYARAPPSPAPMTAIPLQQTARSASPEPRTALARSPFAGAVVTPPRRPGMGFGPVVTPPPNRNQSPAPSLYDAKTIGRGVISSPFRTPPSQRDTVREFNGLPSPGQLSSGYPTAVEPATPPAPASRRQSISNLQLPSTRTGLEVTPKRYDAKSPGFGTARTPQDASTKTGREKSYRQVPPLTPTSHRPGSACAPLTPPVTPPKNLYGNRQYVSGQGPAVTPPRPGFGFGPVVTPPNRNQSPAPSLYDAKTIGRGVISSPFLTPPSQRDTVREFNGLPSPGQLSSGYPTAVEPATPPGPASRRQSISNLQLPSTRTGLEVTPARSPALKTGREAYGPSSARTGREITPARSPAVKTGREAYGPSSARTGREITPARSPALKTGREVYGPPSTRTGHEITPARSPAVKTAREAYGPTSTRTGREITPARSPGRLLHKSPLTTPRPSLTNDDTSAQGSQPSSDSLRTARPVSPCESLTNVHEKLRKTNAPQTAHDPAEASVTTAKPALTPVPSFKDSTRTGREVSSGYPTAVEPATPPSPVSRRQSISSIPVPSTRTARSVTPNPIRRHPSTRSGREVTPQGSGYNTALEQATPPGPASRRQSISNLHVPSTRTGLEVTPRPVDETKVSQRDVKKPKTAAEQWAHIKPGPGPKICPAKSPAVKTAREAVTPVKSAGKSTREPKIDPDNLWKDLVNTVKKQEAEYLNPKSGRAVSPGPAKSPAQRSFACSTARSTPSASLENLSNSELFPPVDVKLIRPLRDLGPQRNSRPTTPPKSPFVADRAPLHPMSASMIGNRPGADTLAPPSTRTAVSPISSQLPNMETTRPGGAQATPSTSAGAFVSPNLPVRSEEGLDRVTIESCDSSESVHSQLSVEINNSEPNSNGGRRKRRMHPSRILLNGAEVWRKSSKK